jgi:hypothetical protein
LKDTGEEVKKVLSELEEKAEGGDSMEGNSGLD